MRLWLRPPAACRSAKDQADLQRCCGGCEQRVQVVNSVINASIKEFQVGEGGWVAARAGQCVWRHGVHAWSLHAVRPEGPLHVWLGLPAACNAVWLLDSTGTAHPPILATLPTLDMQDRLQRCAQRCQDKAQEGLSATPSQKEIDKAQKQLANCLADCAQVRAVQADVQLVDENGQWSGSVA